MSEYDVLINKYNALNAGYDQLYPKPMKHADTHASGGTDPITPSDIGAYNKNETDTLLSKKPNPWLNDNGVFLPGCLVNQRGQTSYTDAGNTIDRWKLSLWQSTSPSLTISDGYITLSNNTAEGTPCTCDIQQIIDNPERFAGQIVTFSVLLGAVTKGSGALFVNITANGSTGTGTEIYTTNANSVVSVTFQLPTEITSLFVFIGASANNAGKGTFSIQLKAAKLELGSQQTLAHKDANGNWVLNEIPDYGEQLRRCQRYCFVWNYGGAHTACLAVFQAFSTTQAYGLIPIPVTMRNKPVISGGSLVSYGKQVVLSSIYKCSNGIRCIANVSDANFTVGQAVGIENGNDNDRVVFSADL